MLQSSSQELAAMEATLMVLHNGLRNAAVPETSASDASAQPCAANRQPLQPLGNIQIQGPHVEVR
jgi:hypothetical protein